MNRSHKQLIVIIISVLFGTLMAFPTYSAVKRTTPDFAFPKKVAATSLADLKKAVDSGDSRMTVGSLINYALAEGAVDTDSIPKVLALISQTRSATEDPATRSLLSLLEAQIYSEIYSSNRWTYDRRELPLTPLPENYLEWSGSQFRNRITALVREATSDADLLRTVPLKNYASILKADRYTYIYYPTLFDFIAYAGGNLCRQLTTSYNLYSSSGTLLPGVSEEAVMTDSLFQAVIATSPEGSAPFIRASLAYIDWQWSRTATEKSNDGLPEKLFQLYDRSGGTEYSGDILREIGDCGISSVGEKRRLYSAIEGFMKKYPAYYGIPCLKNILGRLTQATVGVEVPVMSGPGSEISMKVSLSNANEFSLAIYCLPRTSILSDSWVDYRRYNHRLVGRVTRHVGGTAPFDTTLTVTTKAFPEPGYYVVVPELPGVPQGNGNSYPVVYASRGAIAFLGFKRTGTLLAVDPQTGAPISGAEISVRKNSSREFTRVGKTDSEGFFPLAGTDGEYSLRVGKDFYTPTRYFYTGYSDNSQAVRITGEIFTPLNIYRPGDQAEVAAVVFSSDSLGRRPFADKPVRIVICDVNGERTDTVEGTTDAFGRMTGRFAIPAGRLTGYYSLLLYRGDDQTVVARKPLMVSDYKLPSFRVGVTDVLRSTPADGAVTIKGRVETYSGFGLADASLAMKLSVSRSFWWWRSTPSEEIGSRSIDLNPDGTFETVIEKSVFEGSPYPQGSYTALFTAVSPSGETQTASRSFAMGEAYAIRADIPASIDVSSPVKLDVKVLDSAGQPVQTDLGYLIIPVDGGDTIKGTLSTGNPVVDLTAAAPAIYSLRFIPEGRIAGHCDTAESGNVALYRPDVSISPSKEPLWSPKTRFTVAPGDNAEILYGTPSSESNVLLTVAAGNRIIEQRWIREGAGLHTLKITMPKAMKAAVSLLSVSGYRTSELEFVLSNPATERSLRIERESFRDRLVPGTQEKWTVRIVPTDGSEAAAAVIAGMYNAALDAVAPGSPWQMADTYYPVPGLAWTWPRIQGSSDSYIAAVLNNLHCISVQTPGFNLYGRSFLSSYSRVGGGRIMMKSAMTASADGLVLDEAAVKEEVAANDEMMLAEPQVFNTAARAVDSASPEEKADDAGGTGESAPAKEEAPFRYRDAETPLAFFIPMLTTDPSGRLTIEFEVPDANAAWNFNAVAWTGEMVAGAMNAQATASKPVMVQPNLPRFLRTGDEARLQAFVMNNSDSLLKISTLIEVFDPATGNSVCAPVRSELNLAAGSSGTAEISVKVPDGTAMLVYRVKSSSGDFADGEQTAIPVLPASQPVIETQPFYMALDSRELEVELPKTGKDARFVLQFCENPVWYVVTALPGLSEESPRTSVDAVNSLFATAVAEGILRTNPRIAEAIRLWNGSDRSDSTLVSMLERNQDLKTVLLQATPWMMDARSDTERMERLTLLFDRDRCRKVVDTAVELLAQLQQPDGALGWTPQFPRSSGWATAVVLDCVGGLIRLGFLPEDSRLQEVIRKAVGFIDTDAVARWRKYPDSDFRSYVTLRDLFPSVPLGSEAKAIVDATVSRMLGAWKDYSVQEKAFAAMVFYNHGFRNVGLQVLSSLREYSVYDPTKGMWWPSEYGGSLQSLNIAARILDAIVRLDPGSVDIDRIRQWLVFEKETRNWGDGSTAAAVIASFLAVSDKWIEPAKGCVITVGRHKIDAVPTDRMLGYFRTDISSLNPSGARLKILRNSDTPAWGAVFEQFVASMDDIKAESCDAVRIEKRVTSVDNSGTTLKVGARVRVQLVITASRTMDYVAITDERAACLEPVDQLPGYVYAEGLGFYRENLDSSTRLFIDTLPKGTYILTYDMFVAQAGRFSSGIATVQSQYAPAQTAHSASSKLTVGAE